MDEQVEKLSEQTRATLEERRSQHAKILEALEKLEKSEEWNTLKELVFNEALSIIDRSLLNEALKPNLDVAKIHILQGERNWAKRYFDIKRFADFHKTLLEELNNKLK